MTCSDQRNTSPLPEPLDEITPEVNDQEEKEASAKGIATITKEIMESVNALNTMVKDAIPQEDRVRRGAGQPGNMFDDGAGGTMEVQKKQSPDMLLKSVYEKNKGKQIPFSPSAARSDQPAPPFIMFPSMPAVPAVPSFAVPRRRMNRSFITSLEEEDESKGASGSSYDEKSFVLYRSKQKMMLKTGDVYDVRLATTLHLVVRDRHVLQGDDGRHRHGGHSQYPQPEQQEHEQSLPRAVQRDAGEGHSHQRQEHGACVWVM